MQSSAVLAGSTFTDRTFSHTVEFTLYTLHFTLYTLQSTLKVLYSKEKA